MRSKMLKTQSINLVEKSRHPKDSLLKCDFAVKTSKYVLVVQSKHDHKGDIMLIKARALKGYSLDSLDGDIGSASEFYFDDRYWAVRYLVANTASWLSGKKVLISPYSLNGVNNSDEKVSVQLTKKQIEDSPLTLPSECVSLSPAGLRRYSSSS